MKKCILHRVAAAVTSISTLWMCMMPAGALDMTYTPSDSYQESKYYDQLLDVTLTGNQRADIIAIAASQLGYHESDDSSDLSGTSEDGTSNYTEYGRWYGWQGAWCGLFIAWCAGQAHIPTSIIARQGLAGGISAYSTTGNYGGVFMAYGSYTPRPGDIAYFDNEGDGISDHVELVYSVTDTTITTIGGNTGGWEGELVGKHEIPVSTGRIGSMQIVGFECPLYDGDSIPSAAVDEELGIAYPRPVRTLSSGSSGLDVSWLQTALNRVLDAGLEVDGQFGSKSTAAVKMFQERYALDADGIVGSMTIAKLVEVLRDSVPETSEPETEEPTEVTDPETAEPETTAPETTEPETDAPETVVTETVETDASETDAPIVTEPETEDTTESPTDAPEGTDEPVETDAPPELLVKTGDDKTETVFSWKIQEDASGTLFVWSGESAYLITSNLADGSLRALLPAGTYRAYIETEWNGSVWTSPEITFTIDSVISEEMLGDVNGDGIVDASDSSLILVATAAMGVRGDSGLTDLQLAAADVDHSGTLDATDAAIILDYSASVGAGKVMSFAEYLRQKG